MAGNPERVAAFTGKIRELAKSGLEKDLESLRNAKRKHLLACSANGTTATTAGSSSNDDDFVDDPETIHAWDTGFYHNRVLKEEYGVDTETVRQYFPLDHVVHTTLEIYQELLGLRFMEIPRGAFESWHDEVIERTNERTN